LEKMPTVTHPRSIRGVIPVMLTPFHPDGSIDFEGLDNLTEWYLSKGADALFAVCQSSEMEFLTLDEKVAISRRVVRRVNGRVPVIASGHTAPNAAQQKDELAAIGATGVDALILVTSRLDPGNEGERVFQSRLSWLLDRLPESMPLGFYECPSPFRRLLSDGELNSAARSGRFVVLKDVSCDLEIVRRRLSFTNNTPLSVINANAAIAFEAMKAGSQGFCGVFTNFHPDLYVWLHRHATEDAELATELASFLALSAMAEMMGYPALAKLFHRRLGTFNSIYSRTVNYDILDRFWALAPLLETIASTADRFRERISRSESRRMGLT
jgi:4-hydroxy-tetrahydrodipicolinate synthase